MASSHPLLTRLISLDRFVCDRLLCHAAVGGLVVYKDHEHLTAAFARTLARPLSPVLDALVGEVRKRPSRHGS